MRRLGVVMAISVGALADTAPPGMPASSHEPVDVRFAFQRNRPTHEGVFPEDLEEAPPMGQTLFAMAHLLDEDDLAEVSFALVDARDQKVIAPLAFVRLSERDYGGRARVPSQPFRARAEGRYRDGQPFHAVTAVIKPARRTLPPEPPGALDEKIRQLAPSPGPILVPHARVVSMRHSDLGDLVRLEFDVEVTGESAFHFVPFLSQVGGGSSFRPRAPVAIARCTPGRHHVSVEMQAEHARPGRYRLSVANTDFQSEIVLRGSHP
jgi:hypothetical protein